MLRACAIQRFLRRALRTGASSRGLVPTSRMTSAFSMPCSDELNSQLSRAPSPSVIPSCRQSRLVTPSPPNRSSAAFMDSASCRSPAITPIRSGAVAFTRAATASSASPQLAGLSLPSTRTNGWSSRWRLRPSTAKRVLSEIHSSLTSSLTRGSTRSTAGPRASTRIAEPRASITSTLSVLFSSQGRALNAYGLEVSAPTGHRSITLADSSDITALSR